MFWRDYPRGVVNCVWFWWFPTFDALPVAPALTVPFLLARRRPPISLLRLPARPFPRRLPTACAAIALARLPRMKALFAPFQQTSARPRSAGQPPPTLLIFGITCRTLGRAHGSCPGGESHSSPGRSRLRLSAKSTQTICSSARCSGPPFWACKVVAQFPVGDDPGVARKTDL